MLYPISILPILSTFLERMVFIQIYDYLNANNFLSIYQSRFRPNHYTATALLNVTDDWLTSIYEG